MYLQKKPNKYSDLTIRKVWQDIIIVVLLQSFQLHFGTQVVSSQITAVQFFYEIGCLTRLRFDSWVRLSPDQHSKSYYSRKRGKEILLYTINFFWNLCFNKKFGPVMVFTIKEFRTVVVFNIQKQDFEFLSGMLLLQIISGSIPLLSDLLAKLRKFTKWQLFLLKTTYFFHTGPFWVSKVVIKSLHKSDNCLNLTQDSNLSQVGESIS